MSNRHIGSSLTSFLDDEGVREEVDLRAKKKVLADQLRDQMASARVTRTTLAKRMQTSRTVVNRLLDPEDTSFTFSTLAKASAALAMKLQITLETTPATTRRRRLAKRR